jgi:hypothetical protein
MSNSLVIQATPRLRSAQRFDRTHALSHLVLRSFLATASRTDTSPVPFRTRLTAPAPRMAPGLGAERNRTPSGRWCKTTRRPIDD